MGLHYDSNTWLANRFNDPVKVGIKSEIQGIIDAVSPFDIPFIDQGTEGVVFAEGNPVINLIRVFHSSYFLYKHSMPAVWRSVEPKSDERQYFIDRGLMKYDCEYGTENRDYDGVMFLPSFAIGDDRRVISSFVSWCNTTRTRVLFKRHPALNEGIDSIVKPSDYVVINEDASPIDLICNAKFVISYNSSLSIAGMIYGKPVATLSKCDFSSFIPVTRVSNISSIKPLSADEVIASLWWYKNLHCIDIESKNFTDRVALRKRLCSEYGLEKVYKHEIEMLE